MAQGSVGNVLAAIASFFIPGLGQLLQGRFLPALVFFVLTWGLYSTFIFGIPLGFLGLVSHIWSIVDAARFKA